MRYTSNGCNMRRWAEAHPTCWVLDQYKECTPEDPTVRDRFATCRFADHKERLVDLLGRVARVSVETVRITAAMRALER